MNLNTSTPENRSRANSLTSVNKKTGLHQYTEDKEAHLAAPDLQQRFASTGNLTVTSMQQPDQPMVHLSGPSNQLQPQSMSHLDGQLLHRRFPSAGRLNGHMSPVDQVKILHPDPGYAPPQRRGSNSSLVSSVWSWQSMTSVLRPKNLESKLLKAYFFNLINLILSKNNAVRHCIFADFLSLSTPPPSNFMKLT